MRARSELQLVKNCKLALRTNSRRQDCVGLELETEIRKYLAEYVLYVDDPFDYDGETSFIRRGLIDSTGAVEIAT